MTAFDPAIPQAQPDQDVAAKSLDDRHTFPCHTFPHLPPMPRMRAQRALGKLPDDLVDLRNTLLDLTHADPDACVDITFIQNRDLEAQPVIGRIGEGPARIEGSAGRAADVTSGGILPGQRRHEHAGIDGAILQ